MEPMTFTAPSLKTLERLHWLDTDQCKKLRLQMKKPLDTKRGHHNSHAVFARMKELDILADTHGVEYLETRKRGYEYLNTGDTYCPTIIASLDQQRFFICDWGTLVEQEGDHETC